MMDLKRKETQILRSMLKQISVFLLGAFLLAQLVTSLFLSQYFFQFHVGIELICIFISFLIFVLVWYTYEKNTYVEHNICFCFLMVGFFGILHLLFYSSELSFKQNNLSTWYWLLGRFSLALTLVLFTGDFKFKINKYIGLFFSLFTVSFVALVFYHYYDLLPILYINEGASRIKILIDCMIIVLFLLSLHNLRLKITQKDVLVYSFIIIAVVLALLSMLFHSINSVIPVYHLMGHFLKVACYFFFMKGIFVSAVKYPYQKIEKQSKTLIQILDELPLGVVIYDQNLRLFFANRKALDLLTDSKKDLFGMHQHELVQKLGRIKALEQIGVNKGMMKNIYIDLRNKRGAMSKVRADYYQLSHGYMVMFEELKDNQELETLKVQTRAIINSIKKVILLLDTNDHVFMCNNSCLKVLGMEEEEIIGKNFDELCNYLQCKAADDNIDMSQVKSFKQLEMVSIITPKGNKKILRLYTEQIQNIDSEVIGTLVLAVDITLYKKEHLKIQQREKFIALGKMASGIVHEIKNPLTAIKGFSQLIKYKDPNEKILEYACAIERETDIINNFISDFLKFAKPSTPKLEPVSVNEFIDSLKLVIDTNTFLSGIKVTYNLTSKEKLVMADVNQLRQVVLNIVKNAIEAIETSGGTELIVSTKYHKQAKEFSIKIFNDGQAMSEEDKKLVGTPFFTTKKTGTGLGLSICYQLIKEHSGRIEIESEEGVGTSFIIYLPIVS